MAEPTYTVLDGLDEIAGTVKKYVPRCKFWFGEETEEILASFPRIVWEIRGATPAAANDKRDGGGNLGLSNPRPFQSHQVEIVAVCYGEGRINQHDKEIRRAQYAASEHLMAVLLWGVRTFQSGVSEFLSWDVLQPDGPEDVGMPIEVHFSLRIQLLAPKLPEVQPTELDEDPHIIEASP